MSTILMCMDGRLECYMTNTIDTTIIQVCDLPSINYDDSGYVIVSDSNNYKVILKDIQCEDV